MLFLELDDFVHIADVRIAVVQNEAADLADVALDVGRDRLEERTQQIDELHQVGGGVEERSKQQSIIVVLFELIVFAEEALRVAVRLQSAFEHGAA